jgi:hypothetical protein
MTDRIIGPSGGKRKRRVLALLFVAFAAGMALYATSAFGILAGSPSNFEADDGNMVVDTTGGNDWNSVAFDHVADLFNSNQDDSFTSGQKQDTVCPDVSGHKNPPKDDFTDVASYSETNNDSTSAQFGHTFLYGATIRYAPNGSASENVELKQGDNGTCQGSNLLARTAGDKLIAIDYTQGGTQVDFSVLTWVTSGACFVSNHTAPCWGANVQTLADNAAEGLASQSPIDGDDNDINGADLETGEFAEFGVDLTAAQIIPANSCQSFPQTVWGSRASGSSFVSTTKDIAVENHTIGNGCTSAVSTNPQSGDTQNGTFTNLANNASIASGKWVRDQATVTVTGVSTWGGDVDFYLCKSTTSTLTSCDPDASGTTAQKVGVTKTVSNSAATATSDSTQVTDAGSYCWAAKFTPNASSSAAGVPSKTSTTGECFSVTAPTSIATNPWFYPQDRAVISASSGGNLAGSVSFKLFDNSTNCTANSSDTVGTGGLLYKESKAVSGASPQTVDTSNSSYRVTSSTANNLYWRVTYTSTNTNQTNSSSVCVENMGATITADGTVSFP